MEHQNVSTLATTTAFQLNYGGNGHANTVRAFTSATYECLPPLVGWLAKNERIKFNQFFQALKYVDFLSPETKADKALAKWAFSVVYTRKFRSADGDVKIVPMADMVRTVYSSSMVLL